MRGPPGTWVRQSNTTGQDRYPPEYLTTVTETHGPGRGVTQRLERVAIPENEAADGVGRRGAEPRVGSWEGRALEVVLEGVRAGRWRILVG